MGPTTHAPAHRHGAGRTVLVTGATAGIGFAAARRLADLGARVLLGARDDARGRRAAESVRALVPGADVDVVRVDVADLRSVAAAARRLLDAGPLHAVVANAGVTGMRERRTSPQGHELFLATNHLGHAALVDLLLPALVAGGTAGEPGRVVGAGSIAHRLTHVPRDDREWSSRDDWRSFRAYARSKLAVLLHTAELDRRLVATGAPVRALAFHPGFAVDPLDDPARGPRHPRPAGSAAALRAVGRTAAGWALAAVPLLLQGKDDGARPAVAAALGPGALHPVDGRPPAYVGPGGPLGLTGAPRLVPVRAAVRGTGAAQQLWDLTEALVGDVTGGRLGP